MAAWRHTVNKIRETIKKQLTLKVASDSIHS